MTLPRMATAHCTAWAIWMNARSLLFARHRVDLEVLRDYSEHRVMVALFSRWAPRLIGILLKKATIAIPVPLQAF